MNQMVGADVEALQRLAVQFDRAAERLRQQAGAVSEGIRVCAWAGPVAFRFRVAWDSTHSTALKHAAEALADNARVLRQNAAEQQAASSSLQAGAGTHVVTHGPSAGSGEITPRDYLALAKSAGGGADLPPGWRHVSDDELRKLGIDPRELSSKNGMNASIVVDADGRYVLVFEGSKGDPRDIDWTRENARSGAQSGTLGVLGQGGADVAEIIDPGSSTEDAMRLALKLKNAVGVENMSLTGWSLGGRHAAAASMVTGADAVTFNAAGVTNNDRLFARTLVGEQPGFGEYVLGRMGVTMQADESHITNYRATGDPLSVGQALTPTSDAAGRQVVVEGTGHGLEQFDDKV